jgi:hypothetical protein
MALVTTFLHLMQEEVIEMIAFLKRKSVKKKGVLVG